MSQRRKMSNVLEERLLLSCSTVYYTLTQLAVFIGWHQEDQNTSNGERIIRKWPLDLSSTANEVRAFRTVFLFDVFDLIWVETHQNMCVTHEWNVAKKGQTTCILTNFEKLSRRSQSFAQRNFCSNPENIFSKFNSQKLNRFEGLAHGEK